MRLVVAIIIAIIIYVMQYSLYRKNWDKNLKVTIRFRDQACSVGDENVLIETINNAKSLPLPVIHTKFSADRSFQFVDSENSAVTDSYHRNDVFSVLGNQKITRQLSFRAQKRGYYTIPSLDLVAKDFFLTKTFAINVKNTSSLYVYPAPIKGAEVDELCKTLLGEMSVRKNLIEDPYTFNGIREYSRGDSMRKINWKASARTNDLMVNIYHYSSDQYIKVLLNFEPNSLMKPEPLQEACIGLAAEVCDRFISDGVPVMVASNGIDKISKTIGSVDRGSTMEHGLTIKKYLSRIDKCAGGDAFLEILDKAIAAGEKNVAYVVISPYYRDDLLVKLDYLNDNGVPISMVVPHYDNIALDTKRDYMHGWQVKYNES